MKKLFFIIVFTFSLSAVAQEMDQDSIYKASDVDVKPEYKGGIEKMYKFVAKQYRVPDIEKFKGKVIIGFVVEKDGTLSNFKIISDPGHGTGEEAIRVFQMLPIWSPGQKDGKTVRTSFTFPITLQSE